MLPQSNSPLIGFWALNGILKTESSVSALSMLTPIKRNKAKNKRRKKENKDGSPEGFVYQAESPDEGALVAAASNEFGFQLLPFRIVN